MIRNVEHNCTKCSNMTNGSQFKCDYKCLLQFNRIVKQCCEGTNRNVSFSQKTKTSLDTVQCNPDVKNTPSILSCSGAEVSCVKYVKKYIVGSNSCKYCWKWIIFAAMLSTLSNMSFVLGQSSAMGRASPLIDSPWSSPSQTIHRTGWGPSSHSPNTRHGAHGRSPPHRSYFLSGIRENPQRMAYLSKNDLYTKISSNNNNNHRYFDNKSLLSKPEISNNNNNKYEPPMTPMRSTPLKSKQSEILLRNRYNLREKSNKNSKEKIMSNEIIPKKSYVSLNNTGNKYVIQHIPTNDSSLNNGKGYVTLITSPNDVLSFEGETVSSDNWDESLDPNVCRKIAGLSRGQLEVCRKHVEATGAAAIGMRTAVKECQRQMKNQRWNCSSLMTFGNNPHSSSIMATGVSESGFGHAIVSAGITHSISRACAAGRLNECSCGTVGAKHQWKWSGCHDNTRYGARFSRKFLDVKEDGPLDMVSFTHLHNNEVGRKVVRRNRAVQCKCHGMSGSCEVRTCWKAAPDFRRVGDLLRKKYKKAQMIQRQNKRSSFNRRVQKPDKSVITSKSPLLYVSKSPSYCESDRYLDHPGTHGRRCNSTGNGSDSCKKLCCGRGYKEYERNVIGRCNCHFKWCCKVTCQDCAVNEKVTVCN